MELLPLPVATEIGKLPIASHTGGASRQGPVPSVVLAAAVPTLPPKQTRGATHVKGV
jgi:hypothetical protein